MPICGGNWNNTSNAGVFYVNLNNPRSNSNTNIGFRSALPSYARIGNSKDYRQCEGIKEPVSTPAEKQEKNGAMLMAFADVASVVKAASTYEKTAKHNEIMKNRGKINENQACF